MSDVDHPWVPATWDVIEPGDHVCDPNGDPWHVTAKIDMPGDDYLSFLLERVGEKRSGVWTDRERGSSVQAWRFVTASVRPGAEAFAIGRLRLAGFDVDKL